MFDFEGNLHSALTFKSQFGAIIQIAEKHVWCLKGSFRFTIETFYVSYFLHCVSNRNWPEATNIETHTKQHFHTLLHFVIKEEVDFFCSFAVCIMITFLYALLNDKKLCETFFKRGNSIEEVWLQQNSS